MFKVPEKNRVKNGLFGSDRSYGCNGVFILTYQTTKQISELMCIVSNGLGWEHVSVTIPCKERRCPTWEEMCFVKNMFWSKNDLAVQYHPPESAYINCHEFCLHLWRPISKQMPLPDIILVGPKSIKSSNPMFKF